MTWVGAQPNMFGTGVLTMADSDALLGTLISHYRILEKLGEGGMGVVYKGEDTRLERFAALKFLPNEFANDKQMRDRFLREARAASALNHPNICTIYDVGEAEGKVFIAMEFLDGVTLRELVESGPVESVRLLNIADQVLDGLEAAHEEGIIHRDIKLGNIFFTKSGRAKILDFGLAKKTVSKPATAVAAGGESRRPGEQHLTSGLAALGTAAYMSPEQALGKPLDERTDLFSFGIVLYEMASGRAPFRGDTTGMLFLSIVQENPEPVRKINPDLPEGLQQIVDKCLQKDRDQRYQKAAEIRNDLRLLQSRWAARQAGVEETQARTPVPESWSPTTANHIPSSAPVEGISKAAEEHRPRRSVWRSWKARVGIACLAFLLILAEGLYLRSQHAHQLRPSDSVVLADFTNTTGDSVFDESLKQAARFDLEQSPFLNVLSDRRVMDLLQEMSRPANQRLTMEVTREVCLRSNSKALIVGSITPNGSHYLVGLRALACDTGTVIAESRVEASNRSDVLKALAKADEQLRRKLGESLPSIQKFNRPLEESTTSSLEALQAYTEGMTAFQSNGLAEAVPHFQLAIQLDPNFAQAHAALGSVYYSAGQNMAGDENFQRAYELRNRVNERERFAITANYFRRTTGQVDQAIRTCQEWIRLYPDDYAGHLALGGSYLSVGKLEQAVQSDRVAIQLGPDRISAYVNAMVAYKDLERYDEAKAIFDAARARNLDNDILRINRYVIAFLEADKASLEEQLRWAHTKPGSEDRLLEDWADTQAYYGLYAESRKFGNKAIAAAMRDRVNERSLEHQAHQALREAEVGNRVLVRQLATPTLMSSDGVYVRVLTALALAKVGANAESEKLASELDRNKPLHELVQNYYLPTIRAVIELNKNHPDKSIAILEPALSLERASTLLDGLEPAYVRGQAYLQEGKGSEAAKEFQKLLDHPGLVELWVTGALARLQMARAEDLSGNSEAARKHYQDFFALWKDADPNLPILKQAKAEYARLH